MVTVKIFGNVSNKSKLIREEIKRRLNSSNTCYHSVQNLLYSHLLPKHIKIIKYKTIILPLVPYGCVKLGL
jgi:hypothetical protein